MSVSSRAKGVRARPLADYVLRQIDPLVARRGFGEASLLMQWREIVGARVAEICAPERLQWPPRARRAGAGERQEPAALALRVEPGFGLEIQHMAPTIVDRVNAHLGWRCVSRLILRQQPLARADGKERPGRAPPVDPAARARAEAAADGLSEEPLRAALIRLGERALAPRRKA